MSNRTEHEQTQQYRDSSLNVLGAETVQLQPHRLPSQWAEYEQLEAKASGAMGTVYRGWHRELHRWEAVKVLQLRADLDTIHFERFRFEAEAAAGLDHPNIVPVYRVGQIDAQPFYSMKWIDGGTLADAIPTLQNQTTQIAKLMAKIARAVSFAHQHGILHRDLKPKNIMMDLAGDPHIADFGLARRTERDQHDLTQSGSMIGTPNYMAPEQANSDKNLTTAVDIYALGVILYELLTGRVPFQAGNLYELLNMICHEQPNPPRHWNAKVHPDLQAICLKCLEKDPRDRYASAHELADDLERVARGEGILIRPPALKDWIYRELTKVPAPFPGYVIEVKYWFAGLMLAGQVGVVSLCTWNGPIWGIWLIYWLAWGGCALSLWYYMAARFTRLPVTEQHSVMVAFGHLAAHIVFNLGCLPWTGPAEQVLALYPAYTIISGLALFVIGTTHWGRFYWYGMGLMALLPVILLFPRVAPLVYGVPVSAAMLSWAVMLQGLIRRAP